MVWIIPSPGRFIVDRFLRIAAVLSFFLVMPLRGSATSSSACPNSSQAPLALSLDGVELHGCLPYAAEGGWVLPGADQTVQTAYTMGAGAGYTLTAIPFGLHAPTEIFPRIDATISEDDLREMLRQARTAQGAQTEAGPSAQLFGRSVESLVSTLALPVSANSARSTRLTEWLVIAGKRLWIFRASQPVGLFGLAAAEGLSAGSDSLEAASLSAGALARQEQLAANGAAAPASSDPYTLPSPAWWGGTCDTSRYPGSKTLGSSYRNVVACGPLPGMGYPDVLVYFHNGAFPAYEWECVELALRFMYLAYGVEPYAANGSGIVYNYGGSRLEKVNNGVSGKPPVAGDVLSYGSTASFGHTSVVTSTSVNGSGNGTVTVMEENWTWSGQTTLKISNWWVIGDAGWVYGWLHSPNSPFPTSTPTVTPTPTCIPPSRGTRLPVDLSATPSPYSNFFPFVFHEGC
jgi:hypothetical protein